MAAFTVIALISLVFVAQKDGGHTTCKLQPSHTTGTHEQMRMGHPSALEFGLQKPDGLF